MQLLHDLCIGNSNKLLDILAKEILELSQIKNIHPNDQCQSYDDLIRLATAALVYKKPKENLENLKSSLTDGECTELRGEINVKDPEIKMVWGI